MPSNAMYGTGYVAPPISPTGSGAAFSYSAAQVRQRSVSFSKDETVKDLNSSFSKSGKEKLKVTRSDSQQSMKR